MECRVRRCTASRVWILSVKLYTRTEGRDGCLASSSFPLSPCARRWSVRSLLIVFVTLPASSCHVQTCLSRLSKTRASHNIGRLVVNRETDVGNSFSLRENAFCSVLSVETWRGSMLIVIPVPSRSIVHTYARVGLWLSIKRHGLKGEKKETNKKSTCHITDLLVARARARQEGYMQLQYNDV